MKSILGRRLWLAAMTIVAAMFSACGDNQADEPGSEGNSYTIDFEGDYFDNLVATTPSTWSFMQPGYAWIDTHTSLYHEAIFTNDYGYEMFGGGLTLSSYNCNDVKSFGTYESDLYVYNAHNKESATGGGAGGSDNFLVAYGNYEPEVDEQMDMRPTISFADGRARKIKGCKVCATSYFINIAENGNAFSPALKQGEQIKIYATGYDAMGREGKSVSMVLAQKGKIVKQWTSWDLTPLGKVASVKFNIQGGNTDEWGMTTPKYFALDDIVILEE